MAKEYDKKKYLKQKKVEGKLLKNEQQGELLKPEVVEGQPLWKDTKLNEEKKKKKKLNE